MLCSLSPWGRQCFHLGEKFHQVLPGVPTPSWPYPLSSALKHPGFSILSREFHQLQPKSQKGPLSIPDLPSFQDDSGGKKLGRGRPPKSVTSQRLEPGPRESRSFPREVMVQQPPAMV